MIGSAAWVQYRMPNRLAPIIWRHSLVSAPVTGPSSITPALLTSTSSPPSRSAVPSTNARACPSSLTSVGNASARPPSPAMRSATACRRSSRRPARPTAAPAPARRMALASPIPEVAPVTAATFPSSLASIARQPYSRVQLRVHRARPGRTRAYDLDAPWGGVLPPMDTARRGNYDSGQDFVLEYGELRFTFNERDFGERCEQAALKLGFVDGRLKEPELEDLVNLVVNGEVHDPASALGEHVNDCWPDLVGPAERSLVHWLRRLVFRSAWLDQRVKEGELDVAYEADSQTFSYIQPDRDGEPIELAPEPSWNRVAYSPRS